MDAPEHWGGSAPARVLAPDGSVVGDPDVGLEPDRLRSLLRWMIVARRLDRECIALQRQGELTVYPGFEGQEAAQIGSAVALGPDDMVFPTFRELAAALVRGVDPVRYLWYHRGTWHGGPYDPRATRFGPICIPIATQIPHAAGFALGQQLDGSRRRHDRVLRRRLDERGRLPRGGEPGGRSGGSHSCSSARTTAGRSASRPRSRRRARSGGAPRDTASPACASTATTCSPCIERPSEAVARARAGDGPTLIEALTYRIGAHSTADDASRYRTEDEVERARAFDPIARFRAWLLATAIVDRRHDRRLRGGGRDASRSRCEPASSLRRPRPPSGCSTGSTPHRPSRSSRQRGEALA